MSASGIIGTFLGIRSPGTAYVLLHHYMGEIDGAFRSWGFSRGDTGAISNAIGAAAREAGVEIRTQASVDKIIIKNGRATGVALKSGEELSAGVVSSSVDPHLTFEKFIAPDDLPSDFLESVRRYKYRGSSGKVNMALDALPDFKCMPGPGAHLRGAISISPGIEYMERAYDDRSTAIFRVARTSIWSSPVLPIPVSRRRASMCSPALCNTPLISSRKEPGTISVTHSATPS